MSDSLVALEVCVSSDNIENMLTDIREAISGGADRIELCATMEQGGLTPSNEAIAAARDILSSQMLMVMIRPRAGNFVFSEEEHEQAMLAIELARIECADGVVIGTLDDRGQLNTQQLCEQFKLAQLMELEVTFHRAFDAAVDPLSVWKQLSDFGIQRILTSGTRWSSTESALSGIELLTTLYQLDSQVEMVIGGGVNPGNATRILGAIAPVWKRVSLHTYSGIRTGGRVDAHKVELLANSCAHFTTDISTF